MTILPEEDHKVEVYGVNDHGDQAIAISCSCGWEDLTLGLPFEKLQALVLNHTKTIGKEDEFINWVKTHIGELERYQEEILRALMSDDAKIWLRKRIRRAPLEKKDK